MMIIATVDRICDQPCTEALNLARDAESATHKVADLGHKLFAAPKPHVHPRIMQPSQCPSDKNTNYVRPKTAESSCSLLQWNRKKRRKCGNTSSSITLDLNGNFQQLELTIL